MIEQFLQNLKNSPAAILLGLLVLLLSSLITISNGFSLLGKYYHSTLGRKRNLYRDIGRLSAGVDIGYFTGILGPPVFVNSRADHRESVFVNEYFYVQAITDSQSSVQLFAVTTRSTRFNPTFILGPYTITDERMRVRLGKTRFAELSGFARPSSISSSLGARRFHYYEEYSFGNPGNYQNYVFAVNDAGCAPWPRWQQWDSFDEPKLSDGWNSLENADVAAFRERAVINTYAVTAPFFSLEHRAEYFFGPDYDQVRIVGQKNPKRLTKRARRRLERVLNMSPYEWMKRWKQEHSRENRQV